MTRTLVCRRIVAWAACLAPLLTAGRAAAQGPPPAYRIVLRSRSAEVVPQHNKDGQTGGGYIDVTQREPDAVTFVMRGAVVAGAETHRGGQASMKFVLDQDFEIVPTRAGLRPPRITLAGHLVGALTSSQPEGGEAQQGPACAAVNSAGQPIVHLCVKPHAVGPTENLFVNDQAGAVEAVLVPGGYCLHGSFDLSATAPPIECWCPKVVPAAAAVFAPDPRLAPRWNYVLQPFAAVPATEFGFRVRLTVSQSPAPPAPAEEVPAPAPAKASRLMPPADGAPAGK